MTGLRIVASDGAAWPITASRCTVCKMPRDPAVADSIHPGCRPTAQPTAQPIPDASLDRLVAHLIQHLGAIQIAPPTEGEIAR